MTTTAETVREGRQRRRPTASRNEPRHPEPPDRGGSIAELPALGGLLAETTIGLPAACGMIPPSRGGRRTATSTLTYWIRIGLRVGDRRVKLEAVKTGVWITSVEAVRRFLAATTAAATGGPVATPTPAQRRKAGETAGRRLEAMGL